MNDLWVFTAVAAVLTITPGADMALVTRSTLAGGRRAGFATTVGICLGCLVHAVASGFGLSAILAKSARLYEAVKLCGAAYLIYIGVRGMWGAWRERTSAPQSAAHLVAPGRYFIEGFGTNILNPKVALFYLTFLPQFIRPGDPALEKSVLLASIHILMGLIWLCAYSSFIGSMRALFTTRRMRRTLEGVMGAALAGLGVRLALERTR